ncbi:MAG: DUF2958 domain-containing protein [Chloroflexi bacterium]|nr:DUF2958 domain-containing protein [Chloroflexota bacterium]
MGLLSTETLQRLRENRNHDDPVPVVKLFTPYGNWAWLLAFQDGTDRDKLFGLCDMGIGQPELGYVRLSTLEDYDIRGIVIEHDSGAVFDKPLSHYARTARENGKIVT